MENKLKKVLKSKLFLFLFIFIAISLILTAVFQSLTPEPPPSGTVVTNMTKLNPQISFSDIQLQLPEQFTVYRSQQGNVSLSQFARELASKLGMQQVPNITTTWETSDRQSALSLEVENKFLTYQQYANIQEIEQVVNLITPQEAEIIVFDFIEGNNLLNSFTITQTTLMYLGPEGWREVLDIEDANGVRVTVNQKIDGVPLILGDRALPAAEAYIYLDGKISKIFFYPNILELETIQKYPSLSLNRIFQNAQNGQITFIKNAFINLDDLGTEAGKSVQFTQANIEYRQNEVNGYLLPYIRFSGTGKNEDGSVYDVQAITPAIEIGQ